MTKKILYAYVKSNNYDKYIIEFEGSKDITAIYKEYDDFKTFIDTVIVLSNMFSLKVQFYA